MSVLMKTRQTNLQTWDFVVFSFTLWIRVKRENVMCSKCVLQRIQELTKCSEKLLRSTPMGQATKKHLTTPDGKQGGSDSVVSWREHTIAGLHPREQQ